MVATALAEDLGAPPAPDRDVTAARTIAAGTRARGVFVPREAGVVAGVEAVAAVYAQLGGTTEVTLVRADGDRVEPGEPVAAVAGPAATILAGERTALNLLTHLSGIATLTARFVAAVAGSGCIVRDTRKTLPGLRVLQKAAVRAGGGHNHRLALTTGVLIKDNHAAAGGGIEAVTRHALAAAEGLDVQVEVDSLEQLDVVLAAGVKAVLLDNFSLAELREAVRRGGGRAFLEASGRLTLGTAAAVAATGVDAIAVGALTHSAPALDVGLDFEVT